jgi:hypothetical protein
MNKKYVRKTNKKLLGKWLRETKETNPSINSEIMEKLRISLSTWTKIIYLDGYCPNTQTRILLAQLTGLDENLLFPVVDSSEGEVA